MHKECGVVKQAVGCESSSILQALSTESCVLAFCLLTVSFLRQARDIFLSGHKTYVHTAMIGDTEPIPFMLETKLEHISKNYG